MELSKEQIMEYKLHIGKKLNVKLTVDEMAAAVRYFESIEEEEEEEEEEAVELGLFDMLMKRSSEAQDKKLTSGIEVNNFTAADIAKYAQIVKSALEGSVVNILADEAAKDDVAFVHQDVYITISGTGKGDSVAFDNVTKDDKKRAYAKRRFHGRAQDGRSCFIFFNEYKDDNMTLVNGTVLTLRGINVPVGGSLVTVNKTEKTGTVTIFKKGGWYVFSPFGYKTSNQELQKVAAISGSTVKKGAVAAED